MQTPEYRASTMLQIEPPTPTFLTVTDALVGGGNYWQHADFYNTQFKVLTSKGVGEKAVERLKLEGPAALPGPAPIRAASSCRTWRSIRCPTAGW